MSVLDFISSLVRSLAWPLAAIVLALLIRRELIAALARLSGFEGFGMKLDFGKHASELKDEIEDQLLEMEFTERPTEGDAEVGVAGPDTDEVADLVELRDLCASNLARVRRVKDRLALGQHSHVGAVVESWLLLEQVLSALPGASDVAFERSAHPVAGSQLKKFDVLAPSVIRVIDGLWNLRNGVAHKAESTITRVAAVDYLTSVTSVLTIIGHELAWRAK